MLAVNGSDGFLKPPFSDEAPGADHIGDHVNGENHCSSMLKKLRSLPSGQFRYRSMPSSPS
jgi:hypothetical protein